jgi:hypothetical protein
MSALGNIIAGMFRPPILTAADMLFKRVVNRTQPEPQIIVAPPAHVTLGCNNCTWRTNLCAHCEQVDATNDLIGHYVAIHWHELGELRAFLDPPKDAVTPDLFPVQECEKHGTWVGYRACPTCFPLGTETSVSEPDPSPPES